jgi:hypothetical protein
MDLYSQRARAGGAGCGRRPAGMGGRVRAGGASSAGTGGRRGELRCVGNVAAWAGAASGHDAGGNRPTNRRVCVRQRQWRGASTAVVVRKISAACRRPESS